MIGRRGGTVSDRLLHAVLGLCGHQAGGLLGHTRGEVARVQGASEGPLPLHKRNVLSFPFFSSLNVETICTSTFITEKVYKKFN